MNNKQSRREILAKYVLEHDNFAKAYVNRIWGLLFARGLNAQPAVDDFGGHNKVVHPEMLDFLAKEFVRYKYDSKLLIEWICNSNAYQLASQVVPGKGAPIDAKADPYFAKMQLKAMSPEVLFESIMTATRADTTPDRAEKKQLRDDFMRKLVRNFGDDEGNEITFNGTIIQALLLMNGKEINTEISRPSSSTVERAMRRYAGKGINSEKGVIDELYLSTLGRHPSTADNLKFEVTRGKKKVLVATSETKFINARLLEMKRTEEYQKNPREAYKSFFEDLFWALINSNEFILNH